MRLINADDLKDWSEIVPLTDDGGIDINDFEEKLESMPTVDAEPVRHGHWDISIFDDTDVCSRCGNTGKKKYRYCPYCGAKMDAERKEE